MRITISTLVIAAFVLAASMSCEVRDGNGEEEVEEVPVVFVPPVEGYDTEDLLICTIYFYTGTNVGDRSLTTGPHAGSDGGNSWNHMAWESIITSAIDVGPYGKYVYCACGNGVLASTDGGRNWRLTGGWEMTEIQDIAIGPESPLIVWAAGAYGLYLSEDGGRSWNRPGDPQPFRFVETLCVDRESPDHVLVGTEDGLYETTDRGRTYEKVGPEAPVRSIHQDIRVADRFRVGTDGDGLWQSPGADSGWSRIDSPGEVINCIYQDPDNPDRMFCGLVHGMAVNDGPDGTWQVSTEGFGDFTPVYALLVDSANPEKLYAGARDGFYISENNGMSWSRPTDGEGNVVLLEAVIFDLWQGELYRGPEEPPSDEPGTLILNTEEPEGEEHREVFMPEFDDRAHDAATLLANKGIDRLASLSEGQHVDIFQAIAMIREGHASEALWEDLRARFSDFGHSMFDSFPAISLYLNCEDELPDDIKELIRQGLVSNNIYRGDTENHWLMYYTSLLLTAQTFPETSADEWYTGRTTQENYDEAAGWINEWTRITSTIGQGEFDSPHYFNTYMSPTLLLYEFAEDPRLKRQAGMMADLLLADMGIESLNGRYCGGHSRMYDHTVIMGDHDTSTGYFYLYFGEIDLPEDFASWLVTGVYGSYRCPLGIAAIARLRAGPYVHTEVKRVRNQMRYSELLNSPVYKYTYMTPDFCIGSLQGGILQPIQQHTWDVTWMGSAENTTLFSLHPYYDAYELAMFFPEDPHTLTASVQAQKSTYTNPNKLNSSSPYERVFQNLHTLMAVYNIPEGINHQHVTLYAPDCLNLTMHDGWLFGRDGDTYVAVYPCTPGEWIDEPNEDFPPASRLIVPAGQTAFVVEVGSPYFLQETFGQFRDAILSLPPPEFSAGNDGPEVHYTNRHGITLEYFWSGDRRVVNGEDWVFPSDRLYQSLMMNGGVGEGAIEISDPNVTRTLDFNELTIEERPTINDTENTE